MEANGSSEKPTDLQKKIYTQIEYYFGNHNLVRDKFMQEQLKLDDGWIPLETLVKFNRLSALSKDFAVIASAVKLSPNDLLVVSEDNTKIRRKPELPIPEASAFKESIKGSSIYVKGFPLEVGLDEIKEWFENRATSKVENIHLRRNMQKKFKGSVFAVFDTAENAQKFVDLADHKYKDIDMIVLTKAAYFAKKQDEKKEMKLQNKLSKESETKQDDEEFKNLNFQEGCLLKFSGDLDSFTSREDITEVFKGHGQIKWIDFARGAKEGFVRLTTDAQGALERASAAQLAVAKKGETTEKSKGEEPKTTEKEEAKDKSSKVVEAAAVEVAAPAPAPAPAVEAPAVAVVAPAVEVVAVPAAAAPAVPLRLRGRDVKWEVLEGEAARQVWIRLLKEQQETMNKRRVTRSGGRRGGNHGGRGGGGRGGRGGRRDNREFQGKKTKFESDDEDGDDAAESKKRPLESEPTSEPQAKQAKTE
ncbi:lupus La protein [Petromyzon marinus]|uniref:lupus La protein n=1 Tax=Petromyzon marinus TaxID=7757 RepID=UPI003F702110